MYKNFLFAFAMLAFSTATIAQTTQPSTQPTTQATTQPSKTTKTQMMSDDAPYRDIGDYPDTYTAASMMHRVIDGLGYRFYWATEGLTTKDLAYAPGNDGKTALETVEHVYYLSQTVLNTVKGMPNMRPLPENTLNFDAMRTKALENLKVASDYLRANPKLHLEDRQVVFKRGEKESEYAFWNVVNGPILDAVYHTGQIVSYRRSSGNPSNPKVNLFTGRAPE